MNKSLVSCFLTHGVVLATKCIINVCLSARTTIVQQIVTVCSTSDALSTKAFGVSAPLVWNSQLLTVI